MKAVLRLMLTYFTGTPLLRGFTLLGVIGIVGGASALLYLPPLVGGQGGPSRFSLAQETFFTLVPVAGVLGVVFGASLLPTLFARLASSHALYVLPHGRVKLLVSAFLTLALVALTTAGTTIVYYVRTPLALDVVFQRAFAVSLSTCSLLYVVLWLTGKSSKSQTAFGLLVGALVTIATLLLPLRFIVLPSRSLVGPWVGLAALWSLFTAAFLLAPRLKRSTGWLKQEVAARIAGASYDGGGEVDYLIGTAHPWVLALGQLVPIAIACYFLRGFDSAPNPWLFFVTIISVLVGAIASMAATRGRRLWLRAHWTRVELFRRVEDAFWRHNSYALGVLLVMLVAIGTYLGLPTKMLAFGMGLVVLGTALSTYLGFMITARVGWGDALLAVATMLALMTGAYYVSRPATSATVIVAFEALLVALAWAFRQFAWHRWKHLDWMLCRAEPDVRGAV